MRVTPVLKDPVVYLLIFIFFIVLLPVKGHVWDTNYWIDWATYIERNGITGIYSIGANYPPLFMYLIYIFCLFQDGVQEVVKNIHYLKMVPLIFDFAGALMVLRLIKDTSLHIFYFLLMILNPAYIYNSVLWGQVDGILAALIFTAVFFAWKRNVLLTYLFLLLALNFKLQAIVFLPFIVLLSFAKAPGLKIRRLLYAIIILAIVQALIWLPFIINGEMGQVFNVYHASVDFFRLISMNAYNFWYFFFDDPFTTSDTEIFYGLSFKQWGLFLFFISSAFALLPLLLHTFKRIFLKQKIDVRLDSLMLIGILLPLLFFYFNTQMHERYVHPALLFMAAYAFVKGDFLPYILGSAAYFLNLENVLRFLELNNYKTLIFHPVFISGIYLIVIFYCFYRLYEPFRVRFQGAHFNTV